MSRQASHFQIGPSAVRWEGRMLCIDIEEVSAPLPTRIRGTVRVHADRIHDHPIALSRQPDHWWRAISPQARVEIDLDNPHRHWRGSGYLDSNWGDAPLETAFHRWQWSRAHLSDGRSLVLYEVDRIASSPLAFGLVFHADGRVEEVNTPPGAALPLTGWRIARATRCETGGQARVLRTLTDAPFYARSLISTRLLGEQVTAVHESLSLTRFSSPWVQAMLPFRMPRRGERGARR